MLKDLKEDSEEYIDTKEDYDDFVRDINTLESRKSILLQMLLQIRKVVEELSKDWNLPRFENSS